VVIGNGMSGARAVEEILARGGGRQFTITMFGDEPCGNYDRTLLHRVLAGEDTPAGIMLNTLAWYGDNGITLHAGVRVDRIDRFTRQVFSSDGRVTPYDALVIATGSRPYLPPLDGLYTPGGALKRGVFCFRTLEDARKLAAYLGEGARRAVVVGGGLSGFQAAAGPHAVAGLERRGLEVDVPQAAAAAVLGTDEVRGVRLRDHSEIACGIVVVAAGIRPNVELAVLSGLPVERGLVVDDSLRVQDEEDIYALGECAQHRGGVYSCLPPVWHQAAVLAGHLTGADRQAAFPGSRNPVENRAPGPGTRVV
jgi:nitrite reductase (NADH) large subunit